MVVTVDKSDHESLIAGGFMKLSKLSISLSVLMLMLVSSSLASQQSKLDDKAKKAIRNSNVTMLANWLENGGDINKTTKNGNTLLILASKIGDKPTIDFLLSKQTKVNYQNEVGATALMLAAKYGHDHVVEMLLDEGADPTLTNNSGVSAAQFAKAYGHYDLSQQLQDAAMEHYRDDEQTAPTS